MTHTVEHTRRILEAHERVLDWDTATYLAVLEHYPPTDSQGRPTVKSIGLAWATTVEHWRRDGETPVTAAERLGLYLALHQETYGVRPTLEAVRVRHGGPAAIPREEPNLAPVPLIGGPYGGVKVGDQGLDTILVGPRREPYAAITDPDTGEHLGGYVWTGPADPGGTRAPSDP